MTFQTARMKLTKLSAHDIPNLYALDQDLEVRRYIDEAKPPEPWPVYYPKAMRKIQALSTFGFEFGFWAAHLSDGRFAGWFHLRPNQNLFPREMEIGYRLHSAYWGHGLATEGAQHLIDYAFRLKLPYVMAITLAANVASRRVMEKSGMQFEQEFVYPEHLARYWNETERTAVKYAITSEQHAFS